MARRAYAVRLGANPLAARLHRFDAPALRAFRLDREPGRWRLVTPERYAALIARADRTRAWTYEGPGAWSVPLGPLRSLALRLRPPPEHEKA